MESSSGAVIYHDNEKREYLLLHYESGHWDYVKGHIEENEGEEEALKRETKEEAGIDEIKILEDFRETIQYFYKREGKLIKKQVVFRLAKSQTKKVKLSFEHTGYKWLPYTEAYGQLTFKNAKDILKKANNFLKSRLV